MTASEHIAEADRLLSEAAKSAGGFGRRGYAAPDLQGKLLAAQAHATLAIAKQGEAGQ